MEEQKRTSSIVKTHKFELASKTIDEPASARQMVERAVASLSDKELRGVRGIHIILLA
jgi:hypothetical protein